MRALTASALLVLVLALAGCGGSDEPARSPAAEQLATLCDEARADIEALGLPAEKGIAVVKPWAARGTRLARDIEALEGETPAERAQLRKLSQDLGEYFAGLRLGATVYEKTGSLDGYAAAVERSKRFLESADAVATRLGVPECTVRPFADS